MKSNYVHGKFGEIGSDVEDDLEDKQALFPVDLLLNLMGAVDVDVPCESVPSGCDPMSKSPTLLSRARAQCTD